MNTQTRPIVAYSDTVVCDGPCGREATLWTDGHIGYATGTADVGTLLRDGAKITGDCLTFLRHGPQEICSGVYVWDLSTEGTWHATTEQDAEMLGYGVAIEADR